ncbi:MAG: hypothetical protein PHY31_01885 [Smithellaceae bacterium]|nr:hypothetical protein [Smithellaceae bacterium]
MKASLKASLWSALVFPGAGQIALGRRSRGLIIMALTAADIILIIAMAVSRAMRMLNELQNAGQTSLDQINQIAARASQENSSSLTTLAVAVLLCLWVFAVIDAYRLGRDREG